MGKECRNGNETLNKKVQLNGNKDNNINKKPIKNKTDYNFQTWRNVKITKEGIHNNHSLLSFFPIRKT